MIGFPAADSRCDGVRWLSRFASVGVRPCRMRLTRTRAGAITRPADHRASDRRQTRRRCGLESVDLLRPPNRHRLLALFKTSSILSARVFRSYSRAASGPAARIAAIPCGSCSSLPSASAIAWALPGSTRTPTPVRVTISADSPSTPCSTGIPIAMHSNSFEGITVLNSSDFRR